MENVVQAPNLTLVCMLSGTRSTFHHKQLVEREGGLDCRIAAWPDTGRLWRAGFNPYTVEDETHHLRTAAWLVIAYLSGMRDAEIRELAGDVAEWVVLDVVHRAVHVIQRINTDPTQTATARPLRQDTDTGAGPSAVSDRQPHRRPRRSAGRHPHNTGGSLTP